jgi:dimethylamine--corrinoid protein Co-methyltransferase
LWPITLAVSVDELADETMMREVREDLRLGGVYQTEGLPKGIEIKHHIAEILGIEINSVNYLSNMLDNIWI